MISAVRKAFIPETWTERAFWVFIAIPAAILIWQAFDRAVPSQIIERTVVTPEVRAGGMLVIRNRTQQNFEAEVSIYRTLYDGFNLRFEYGVQVIPPRSLADGLSVYMAQFPVSPAAAPGNGKLVTTACWARPFNVVHQVWPVCVTLKTLTFTILPAAPY